MVLLLILAILTVIAIIFGFIRLLGNWKAYSSKGTAWPMLIVLLLFWPAGVLWILISPP